VVGLVVSIFLFFLNSLPRNSGFRWAKQTLAFISSSLYLYFAKIFAEIAVENHKEVNGLQISSTRAVYKDAHDF